MKLLCQAITKYITGVIFVGALLFLPAGSFSFLNGWLFMGLLFIPMLLLGVVLYFKAPNLLEKRLGAKEKENSQKAVVFVSALLFVAGFVVAGLDYRFSWSYVPDGVVIAASVILLIAYGLYGEVMRENAYLSRTVEVQENQTVIDTGLYGIVRHPMYAVTIWLFLAIPVVLGSWWSFLCFLPYPIVIVLRIGNEERVLEQGLEGYSDYKKQVKYRILPFVW